jgi:hypothetical protein
MGWDTRGNSSDYVMTLMSTYGILEANGKVSNGVDMDG